MNLLSLAVRVLCLACVVLTGCYDTHTLDLRDAGPFTGAADGGDRHEPDAAANAGSSAGGGSAGAGAPTAGTGPVSGSGGHAGTPGDGGSGMVADIDAGPPVLSTEANLRVAFIGDQRINDNAKAVLRLIRDEGTDMVIHSGDFDYVEDVAGWDAQITGVLGADYPYFAAIGNHDVLSWSGPSGYQAVLQARLARIAGAVCSGDLGVNSVCHYRGLRFVLSGVGTHGTGTEDYLESAIEGDEVWRMCVWHKNQHDMQVGGKPDEVGWRAYRICQASGAPIITAHEHSYGRTHTLTDLGNAPQLHGFIGFPEKLNIGTGSTAVFQTGLGGASTRAWNGDFAPWWASIYAIDKQQTNGTTLSTDTTIEYGALFIDFHVDKNPYLARGYFKTVSGRVVDQFTMRALR